MPVSLFPDGFSKNWQRCCIRSQTSHQENAAPGENTFNIKTAAIGAEPVAHTYKGTDAANTISMFIQRC